MRKHRSAVITAAVALPLIACALIIPFRDDVQNTNAALVLVLLVVAAAATGIRAAGLAAAISGAVWFDFFLTQPYETFSINDRGDIETAVLLVLAGVAVTEIALWGRRQQAKASRQEGYLNGVVSTAGLVAAGGSSPGTLVSHVADQLVEVLEIDASRFDDRPSVASMPRIQRDGTVVRAGRTVDVDRHGLPTDTEIELPVQHDGVILGHFLLTAATRIARPSAGQRQVAIALADQAGAALATTLDHPAP